MIKPTLHTRDALRVYVYVTNLYSAYCLDFVDYIR
jgi:hypothetical protein